MKSYSMNKVEGFNPYDYLEDAHNRKGDTILKKDGTPLKYLSSAAKILWFRKKYPTGVILTKALNTPEQDFGTIVKYEASVYLNASDALPVASWQHQETCWDIAEMDNIVSKVQTIAIGKALSKAGFGCEIELALGAVSEGETPEEPEKEATPEPPKKKRGRPKKAVEKTEEDLDVDSEIDELLKASEELSATEPEEKESADEKLNRMLSVKLAFKKNTKVAYQQYEGLTLEQVRARHPMFCSLVKTRPNVRECLTDECVEAAIYIADHADDK